MDFLLLVFGAIFAHPVASRDCTGTPHDLYCYTYSATEYTWTEAFQYCLVMENARLPVVTDQGTQDFLEGYLAGNSAAGAWLGATEESNGDWHWTLDGQPMSVLGCYVDSGWGRDLTHQVTIPNLIPVLCINICRALGYTYAGVQSRSECYCGDSYGRYGRDPAGCTATCAADNSQYCGGFGSNTVYHVNGTSGSWDYLNPDDAQGYETCGALSNAAAGRAYVDLRCNSTDLLYVCDLPTTAGTCDSSAISGHCIYLGSQTTSWFKAREDCVNQGGDLLKVNDSTMQDLLVTFMDTNAVADALYWVGLVRSQWMAVTGDPVIFTDWASQAPNVEGDTCAAMATTDGYKWNDYNCSNTFPVVCQYEYTPPPTTTSVPTTQAPTTQAPTTQASTTQAPTTQAPTTQAPTQVITTTTGATTSLTTAAPDVTTPPAVLPESTVAMTSTAPALSTTTVVTTQRTTQPAVVTNPTSTQPSSQTPTTAAGTQPPVTTPSATGGTASTQPSVTADGVTAETGTENMTSSVANTSVSTMPSVTSDPPSSSVNTTGGGTTGHGPTVGGTPASGASTDDSNGWTGFQTALLVAIILLIIAIIIAVVVFIWFKKNERATQVEPDGEYAQADKEPNIYDSPMEYESSQRDLVGNEHTDDSPASAGT